MKQILTVIFVGWLGALAWVLIDTLSADAVAMGLGVVLGVLAGVPLALLIAAAGARSAERPPAPPPPTMQQPPVILMGTPRRGELPGRRYINVADGRKIEEW